MIRAISTKRANGRARDDYLDLVRELPLRPIRDDDEYGKASQAMMRLALKGEGNLSAGERDYLDAITVFVTRYDDAHYSLARGKHSPLDRLKYLMVENGMKAIDLGKLVGGRAQASLILSGKREMSKANIRALAERFKVSPALFFQA